MWGVWMGAGAVLRGVVGGLSILDLKLYTILTLTDYNASGRDTCGGTCRGTRRRRTRRRPTIRRPMIAPLRAAAPARDAAARISGTAIHRRGMSLVSNSNLRGFDMMMNSFSLGTGTRKLTDALGDTNCSSRVICGDTHGVCHIVTSAFMSGTNTIGDHGRLHTNGCPST